MKLYLLLLYVVVSLLPHIAHSLGKSPRKAPVVPGERKISIFHRTHNLLKKAVREAKLPFCSDLERLALQLTRPTSDQVSEVQVKQLVELLNTDYDDPQLMVGLLVKLSRKYSEKNVFTKLKSLLVLHRLTKSIHALAQRAVSKSFSSLQMEQDEKIGKHFFDKNTALQSTTGVETSVLDAIELFRQYSQYVFDYVTLKGENGSSKASKRVSSSKLNKDSEIDKAEAIMSLLALGEGVELTCKRVGTSLAKQCSDTVKEDRSWALTELKRLYENNAIKDDSTREAISTLLSRLEPKQAARRGVSSKSVKIGLSDPKTGSVGLKSSVLGSAGDKKVGCASTAMKKTMPAKRKPAAGATTASARVKKDVANKANQNNRSKQ